MIKSWKTRARLDILKFKKRKGLLWDSAVTAIAIGARRTIAHNRPPFYIHIKTKKNWKEKKYQQELYLKQKKRKKKIFQNILEIK